VARHEFKQLSIRREEPSLGARAKLRGGYLFLEDDAISWWSNHRARSQAKRFMNLEDKGERA
jgi:hypothetical protein